MRESSVNKKVVLVVCDGDKGSLSVEEFSKRSSPDPFWSGKEFARWLHLHVPHSFYNGVVNEILHQQATKLLEKHQ